MCAVWDGLWAGGWAAEIGADSWTKTDHTGATPPPQGKHVVFGAVTRGMNLVYEIEKLGSITGQLDAKVVIADCGEVDQSIPEPKKVGLAGSQGATPCNGAFLSPPTPTLTG